MSNSTIQQITSNSLEQQPKKAKGKEINPFVLMFIVIIIATVLNHVLPAGQYERVEKDGRTIVNSNSFEFVDSSPVGLLDMFSSSRDTFYQMGEMDLSVFPNSNGRIDNLFNYCPSY
ncbi:hypothetical protein LAV79_18420 [Peribacillus butanolivorans]|uniref:hypothetical protein n=1 Tax=Peribacillus butanolivorans TaxID=421767 RepID=UPI0030C97B3D